MKTPRLRLLSSAPALLFPCGGPAGDRAGKTTATKGGVQGLVLEPLCVPPNRTLQNPAAPAHIFKLTYKIFLDEVNSHKGYNYHKSVNTNF